LFNVAEYQLKERNGVSEERESFWITLAEKFFGLLLVAVSLILLYFTFTSTAALGLFSGLFGFLGFVVLIAGAFMIVVKAPE
jgi:hypothetical protein